MCVSVCTTHAPPNRWGHSMLCLSPVMLEEHSVKPFVHRIKMATLLHQVRSNWD